MGLCVALDVAGRVEKGLFYMCLSSGHVDKSTWLSDAGQPGSGRPTGG